MFIVHIASYIVNARLLNTTCYIFELYELILFLLHIIYYK